MKLYFLIFISLLLSFVVEGQTNGLNGGTVSPLQTLLKITSTNGSVTVTHGSGPVVDLSVNTNGGGGSITNGTNNIFGTVIITNGYFSGVTMSNVTIVNGTIQDIIITDGITVNGSITNLSAIPNQVAWWDGNQTLVSTNILSASSIDGVDLTNATTVGATNIITVTNIAFLTPGAIKWGNSLFIGNSNGVMSFANLFANNFTFGSSLGATDGQIYAGSYYGENYNGSASQLTNYQSTNIAFIFGTNQLTYLWLYDGAGNIGLSGNTNLTPNFGTNIQDISISNGICFSNAFNLGSNYNWITYYLNVTNALASYPLSFNKMVANSNLLGGLTNGYIITNGVWTLQVYCVGTNTLNERWFIIPPNMSIMSSESGSQTSPYYVSTNGNDANTGITPQTPWKTMQHAEIAAASNSTVLLFGGQTFSNQFTVMMTNALTWSSYGSSQAVITSSNFLAHGIVQLQGSAIVISNLTFSGNMNYVTNYADPLNQGAGIYLGVGGASTMSFSNIQVVGCYFTSLTAGVMFRATNGTGSSFKLNFSNNSGGSLGEAGIMLSVSGRVPNQFPFTNVTITGNSISNVFGFPNVDSAFPVGVTGCTNLLISGNNLHDSGQSQSGSTGGAGGIVVVGSGGFEISRNIVHDIWNVQPFGKDGVGIDADLASQNGTIHDNLVYHCHGAGYDFFSCWGNVSLYHNLSAFNGIGFLQGMSPNQQNSEVLFDNSDTTDSTGITNFLVYSNILVGNATAPLHFSDALSFGANFISNNILVTLAGNVISWDGINGTTFNTNNYWSVGNGVPEILWNNVTYNGIAAWQTATSQDPNARLENPYQYGMFIDWPDKDFFSIFNQLTYQYFYSPNQGPTVIQTNKRNVLIAGGGNPAMNATNNVFVSPTSGASDTTGSFNLGGAPFSLFANTTGSENYAPATSSLLSNISGSHNSTSGPFDMNDNIDGSFDDVSGEFALMHGIHASNDVAHGYNSQLQGISNQFATSSGANSAKSGTNLVHIVADGDSSLVNMVSGTNVYALGASSGANITHGQNIIAIGHAGHDGTNNQTWIGTSGVETNAEIAGAIDFVDGKMQVHGTNDTAIGNVLTIVGAGGAIGFAPSIGSGTNVAIVTSATFSNIPPNIPYTNTSGSVQIYSVNVSNLFNGFAGSSYIRFATSNANSGAVTNLDIGYNASTAILTNKNLPFLIINTNAVLTITDISTGGNAAVQLPNTGQIITIGNATASGVGALGGNNVWTGVNSMNGVNITNVQGSNVMFNTLGSGSGSSPTANMANGAVGTVGTNSQSGNFTFGAPLNVNTTSVGAFSSFMLNVTNTSGSPIVATGLTTWKTNAVASGGWSITNDATFTFSVFYGLYTNVLYLPIN